MSTPEISVPSLLAEPLGPNWAFSERADLDWARVSDDTLRGDELRAEIRTWPGRDFMKNIQLLEADGALHARAAMLKASSKGGIANTRIRRGFFRTVARR